MRLHKVVRPRTAIFWKPGGSRPNPYALRCAKILNVPLSIRNAAFVRTVPSDPRGEKQFRRCIILNVRITPGGAAKLRARATPLTALRTQRVLSDECQIMRKVLRRASAIRRTGVRGAKLYFMQNYSNTMYRCI